MNCFERSRLLGMHSGPEPMGHSFMPYVSMQMGEFSCG